MYIQYIYIYIYIYKSYGYVRAFDLIIEDFWVIYKKLNISSVNAL